MGSTAAAKGAFAGLVRLAQGQELLAVHMARVGEEALPV